MTATERSNATTRLPNRTIASYAIGSLGTGGFATLPGLVLVYYLTDTLGVTALVAGILVTAAKVWDVVIDPVIGGRSDRDLARTGSRRRFMVLGAILLPVFFILTFAVPAGMPPLVAGGWVLVAFVLAATAFSLFQVPYIALPAELSQDYDERTRLLTWRVVVLTFAILLFGAGGPALRSLGGGSTFLGYLLMAVVAGLVIGTGMFASSFVAKKGLVPAVAEKPASIRENYAAGFRTLKRSQPFRALLATFLLQGLATGLMLAGAQYVATWVLKSEDAVTFLFIALIAPALLAAPLWGRIANRIGKERGFVWASIIFGLAALSLLGLLWAPGAWVYLPVAVAGAAYAGMQSLPMAMLPDVISDDAVAHGDGQAGTFGGMWTAGETTGMALGATVLTIVLAIAGYAESTAGVEVVQSSAAIAGIVLSFSVVPAAILGLSLVTLARYRLRKNTIGR
ncbi:MFS transporter [Leifsonia bigeumensis]|uniref:MFS transporter n=1 Tax=Leifsonella bigeumensis TaxID=433643 RepID=A0ABP7FUU4_9MICO